MQKHVLDLKGLNVQLNRPKQLPWNEILFKWWDGELKTDRNFVVEPKRDGVRMVMGNGYVYDFGDNKQYCQWNQDTPIDLKTKFPELINDFSALTCNEGTGCNQIVLDGELVTDTENGDNFWNTSSRVLSGIGKQRLLSQIESRKVKYIVFDILLDKGKPCINMELRKRRQILEDLFRDKKLERIKLIERLHQRDATEDYCNKHNLEGVIVKRNNEPYTSTWYKAKAYVDGVFEIRSVRDGKRDYIMTLYDGETCVGDCTLFAKHVETATMDAPLGPPAMNTDTLIGKCVEVSYMKGNTVKLRFPVFKRFVK